MQSLFHIRSKRLMKACGLAAAAAIAGCRAGGQDLSKVNNQLRDDNLHLKDELHALQLRFEETTLKLKAKAGAEGELPADIQANVPRVTAISVDSLSHLEPSADGLTLLAYVKPVDGRGRFTQMVGSVSLVLTQVGEGAEAVTVAGQTFDPFAVREAYRSGFMGTHYAFELQLPKSAGARDGPLTLMVQFADGITGAKLAAERQIEVPQ